MSGVLAQLLGQVGQAGVDAGTLRAIVEEAGELGATRALQRIGLSDEDAGGDVRELRELLKTWREAKRSAWRSLWGWAARIVSTVLLAGLAVELGSAGWLE